MTSEDIKNMGLPDLDVLTVQAAFEWILANTTLEFDINNPDELKTLPSCVKLFVIKFCNVLDLPVGVSSESIGGMSQSFDNTQRQWLVSQYADELLSEYMKSGVKVFRAQNRWSD